MAVAPTRKYQQLDDLQQQIEDAQSRQLFPGQEKGAKVGLGAFILFCKFQKSGKM